jgi:hypothetical protein
MVARRKPTAGPLRSLWKIFMVPQQVSGTLDQVEENSTGSVHGRRAGPLTRDGKRIVVASRWVLRRDSRPRTIGIVEIKRRHPHQAEEALRNLPRACCDSG